MGPMFCVQGCDIARACEGYITSRDTKQRSYMQYIGPIKHTIYNIYMYCMMVTIYKTPHIKGMMSPYTIYMYTYMYIHMYM